MSQKIRIWEITSENTLTEIGNKKIDLEERLEDWLESDISILDSDLLVIGRQVITDYRGKIDLLCMDSAGDLVVIELKRDKTSRDVTAQALDYASWAKDLGRKRIEEIWNTYMKPKVDLDLEKAFNDKFDSDFPETINASHKSLVVAPDIDDETERIVRYLSDLNVPINVATVQFFANEEGKRILAQVYLIEPEIAEEKAKAASKRSTPPNKAEMQIKADEAGVGELYRRLCDGMVGILTQATHGNDGRGFSRSLEGKWRTYFVAELGISDQIKGLALRINGIRTIRELDISEDRFMDILPDDREEIGHDQWRKATEEEKEKWIAYRCYFKQEADVDRFVSAISAADKQRSSNVSSPV